MFLRQTVFAKAYYRLGNQGHGSLLHAIPTAVIVTENMSDASVIYATNASTYLLQRQRDITRITYPVYLVQHTANAWLLVCIAALAIMDTESNYILYIYEPTENMNNHFIQ